MDAIKTIFLSYLQSLQILRASDLSSGWPVS